MCMCISYFCNTCNINFVFFRFSCHFAISEYENSPTSSYYSKPNSKPNSKLNNKLAAKRNVNLGFSVDFHPKPGAPPPKMSKMRQYLTTGPHNHQIHLHDVIEEVETPPGLPAAAISTNNPLPHKNSLPHDTLSVDAYDTFDNYLRVVNEMDSILSFYYMEGNKVHVTEIFALENSRPTQTNVSTNTSRFT